MSVALPRIGTVWKFSRPHAFVGTAASIFGLWLIALAGNQLSLESLGVLLLSFLVCLSAAFFIVGLNQYFDIAIDEVNKPFLPLASKELSLSHAKRYLALAAAIAWIGMMFFDRYLIGTVVISSLLGIAYSAPPLRLKRSAGFAALLIILVRGPVINLGLFGHFQSQYVGSQNVVFPKIIWLLCILSSLIAFCIAVCKDIPDVKGDRQYDQSTFAQRFGQRRVFAFVLSLLALSFLGIAIAFYFVFEGWLSYAMVAFQLGMLIYLLAEGMRVDATNKSQVTRFYLLIWNIFLMEYLVVAVAYYGQLQIVTANLAG